MTQVGYVPGERTALISDDCWILLDAAPESIAVRDIWQRMRHDPRLGTLIPSLIESGMESLPDFAALIAVDGRFSLICRGRTGAAVLMPAGTETVTGAGLVTWREQRLSPHADGVILGGAPSEAASALPVAAGVLMARCVVVELAAAKVGRDRVPIPRPAAPAEPAGYDFLAAFAGKSADAAPLADGARPVSAVPSAMSASAGAAPGAVDAPSVGTARPAMPSPEPVIPLVVHEVIDSVPLTFGTAPSPPGRTRPRDDRQSPAGDSMSPDDLITAVPDALRDQARRERTDVSEETVRSAESADFRYEVP